VAADGEAGEEGEEAGWVCGVRGGMMADALIGRTLLGVGCALTCCTRIRS
jgi:hypothetical protein